MDSNNVRLLASPQPFLVFIKRHHLAIILIAVFLKQLVLVWIVPPWQVPDEPAHFQYVQTIVEQGVWPIFTTGWTTYSRELIDSYNVMSKKYHGRVEIFNRTITYATPANISRRWAAATTPHNVAALYGPPYYLYEAIPYLAFAQADIDTRLYAMRAWSSLLFLALVWVAYRIGRLVRSGAGFAAVLAILIGFQPMVSYISVGINNDTLVYLLGGLLFGALVAVKPPATPRTAVFLGLLAGLATLTKQSGWIFIVAVGIVLWRLARHQGQTLSQRLRLPLLATMIGGAVGTLWSVMNYLTGGGDFVGGTGLQKLPNTLPPTFINVLATDIVDRSRLVFERFWGSYGWSGAIMEHASTFYLALAVLCFMSVVGLVLGRWLWRHEEERPFLFQRSLWIGTGLFVLLDVFLRSLYWQRALKYHSYSFPAQGRYYFVLIIPLAIIFLHGLEGLVDRRWRRLVWAIMAIGMILLSVQSMVMMSHWFDLSQPVQ